MTIGLALALLHRLHVRLGAQLQHAPARGVGVPDPLDAVDGAGGRGKSGPGIFSISRRRSTPGSSMSSNSPSTTSPRLCGGTLVAMPTAMPAEPLTSRLGSAEGSTVGSRSELS
jgi:hypothetical protein